MNVKDIAATLAILGSGALVLAGCGKDAPSTEVPSGGDAAAPTDAAPGMDDVAGGDEGGDAEGGDAAGGEEGGDAEGGEGGEEGEASCGG